MPTNTGGSYIMKLAQYNSTFDKSTGELVIFNGNSDVDNGITFYNNGGITFRASEDNELVLPNENQGSHGGPLVNEEFAIIQANGEVKRSQIGIDDPILNNSNPNQYEVPYYNSDDQLLDRSLGLRFEDALGLIIGDTNNSITTPGQDLTIDGGGISYRFGNTTPTSDDYFYTGTINLSSVPSSYSGTSVGTNYGNYTSDWKFLNGRTLILRGSTNPLSTGIAAIVGSTASEKLAYVVYPSGTMEFGYDATFRDAVNITDKSGTPDAGAYFDGNKVVSGAMPVNDLTWVQSGTAAVLQDQDGAEVVRLTPDNYFELDVVSTTNTVVRHRSHGAELYTSSQSLTAGQTVVNFTTATSFTDSYITGSTSTEEITSTQPHAVHIILSGYIENDGAGFSTSAPFELEIHKNGAQVAQTKITVNGGTDEPLQFFVSEIDEMTSSDDYTAEVFLPTGCTATIRDVKLTVTAE